MSILSLQNLPLDVGDFGSSPVGVLGGAFIGGFLLVILIGLALYVYFSLAYSKIGKKVGLGNPGIAWMPYGGWLAIIFETAKAHWWPFLALTIGIALSYLLVFSVTVLGSVALILGGGFLCWQL